MGRLRIPLSLMCAVRPCCNIPPRSRTTVRCALYRFPRRGQGRVRSCARIRAESKQLVTAFHREYQPTRLPFPSLRRSRRGSSGRLVLECQFPQEAALRRWYWCCCIRPIRPTDTLQCLCRRLLRQVVICTRQVRMRRVRPLRIRGHLHRRRPDRRRGRGSYARHVAG